MTLKPENLDIFKTCAIIKDMNRLKKLSIVLIIISGLVTLLVLIKTELILRIYDNLILDSKNHYLPCEQLPLIARVEQVVKEHQDVIREIEQVNPGFVFVTMGTYEDCIDKSDIVISYASHQNRLKIEKIINNETFFGIPYTLHNR